MKEEARLTQKQLDKQRSTFIAAGGVVEFVEITSSADVIAGLKSIFQKKTIETWTKLDSNRMRKKK